MNKNITFIKLEDAKSMSTNRINKRNAALAAAYATVDKCFKDYRERVVERFDEEKKNRENTTK